MSRVIITIKKTLHEDNIHYIYTKFSNGLPLAK